MQNNDFILYAKLLEQARKGDDKAFCEIYRRTWQAQEYHLHNLLDKPEDVKDALQEVYLLLYKNMDKINPPTVLVAYLNRLSYNVGKNMARREYYRTSSPIDTEWMKEMEEPEALEALNKTEKDEQLQAVRKALDSLPIEEKAVMFMRYYQKMKYNEVALSLRISLSKAKRLQKSAQQRLRVLLKKQGIMSWEFLAAEAFGIHEVTKDTKDDRVLRSHILGRIIIKSIPKSGILAGIAAAGLSLAVAGAIVLPARPEIQNISTDVYEKYEAAELSFKVSSVMPLDKVTLTAKDKASVPAVSKDGRTFRVSVKENGKYTLTASARNGKSTVRNVKVSCIDSTPPKVVSLDKERGFLAVTFNEKESGLNYDSICYEDKNGDITVPIRRDSSMQKVWFILPKEDIKLHVSDMAGNTGWLPIYRNEI